MIWYRHWLEMRAGVLLATVTIAVLVAATAIMVDASTALGRIDSPLTRSLDGDELLAWAAYAVRVSWTSWLAALIVGGTGVRSQFQPSGSAAFTLTLPVSRRRIMATRLVMAVAAGIAIEATLLAMHGAFLVASGRPVPFGPLVQTFLLVVPVMCTWVGVTAALVSFLAPLASFLGNAVALLLLVLPAQWLMMSLPPRLEDARGLAVGALLLTAIATWTLTLRYAPRSEF